MSKLNVKAKVMYMPGPWGLTEPVKGASVKIIDVDVGGTDDVIFSARTSSLGRIAGRTSDWQDTRRTRVWEPFPLPGRWVTKKVPDLTDIMLLEVDIREGSHHVRAPFIFLGNNVEVPIIVPWGKSDIGTVVGTVVDNVVSALTPYISVNNHKYTSPMDAQKAARKHFEDGTNEVTIELIGPEALVLIPFADKNLDDLKDLVDAIMPGAKDFFYSNPIGVAELSAIALIILASGAVATGTVLASCVGFSLILGVYLGYTDISLEVVPGSGQNPMPGVKFNMKKPLVNNN